MRTILFAVLSSLAPAASALEFDHAWIREAPPGAAVLAGYVEIENDGKADVTLVSATSTAFGEVEMHEMSMAGGVMKMRALDALTIKPGETFVLKPGATHLMLMEPVDSPKAGDAIAIEFVDDAGRKYAATFTVKRSN